MQSSAPLSIAPCDRPSAVRIIWTSVLYDDALAVSLLASCFAAILATIAMVGFSSEYQFLFQGAEARGQVLGKVIAAAGSRRAIVASVLAHGGRRGPRPHIDYEFIDAAGVKFGGRSAVSDSVWNNIAVGDAVDVLYLPGAPETNRLVDASVPPMSLVIVVTLAAGLAIGTALRMLWVGITHVRTNLELFQTGTPALATINEIVNLAARKSRPELVLHYSYQAPEPVSGRSQAYSGKCPGAGRRGKTARQGDALLVCYDEHEPQRHAVDRYGLFALDWKPTTSSA